MSVLQFYVSFYENDISCLKIFCSLIRALLFFRELMWFASFLSQDSWCLFHLDWCEFWTFIRFVMTQESYRKIALSSLVKKHKWCFVLLGHISVFCFVLFCFTFLSYIRTCWFDSDKQKWYLLCLISYFIFHFKFHLIILAKLLVHIFSALKSNSILFLSYIFPLYRNNNNYIYSC